MVSCLPHPSEEKEASKMAPPASATAEGNAVNQKTFIKHTGVLQVRKITAFKHLQCDTKLLGYLDGEHTLLFLRATN